MRRIPCSRLWFLTASLVMAASSAWADPQSGSASAPQDAGRMTRVITWASGRFTGPPGDGFYPEVRHMIPGAGLAAGPGYRRHLFEGRAVVSAAAQMSSRRYSMARTSLDWPAAFGGRVSFTGSANYLDAARVNDFGIGGGTSVESRTHYRIRALDVTGSARLRLTDSVAVTTAGGMLTRPSLENGRGFIVQAPRYLHADISVERDSRDAPAYPTRGGLYRLSALAFHDADASGQSFRRVDADAVRYLPVFSDKAGLAVHGRVTLSQTGAGNTVPFYLLPTLGGGSTLRGYTDYRFRDRNAAGVNLEYIWRVFLLMDAAVFTDIGTVAEAPHRLLSGHRSRDYGFGVRLHSKARTIGRIDIARSPEGTRLVLGVAAPFGSTERRLSVPYVP